MGAGVEKALDMVAARKSDYKKAGIAYFRLWVFMITDGAPTDSVDRATQRVHEAETNKATAFFAVGVESADMDCLARIAHSERKPLKLQGLKFVELFQWLSASLTKVGVSQPGQMVALPPPTGWQQV